MPTKGPELCKKRFWQIRKIPKNSITYEDEPQIVMRYRDVPQTLFKEHVERRTRTVPVKK